MSRETTTGEYRHKRLEGGGYEATASDPVEPTRGGPWRMTGSAAADGLLFWFWESYEWLPAGSHS